MKIADAVTNDDQRVASVEKDLSLAKKALIRQRRTIYALKKDLKQVKRVDVRYCYIVCDIISLDTFSWHMHRLSLTFYTYM